MKIAVFHNLPSGGAKRALYGHLEYFKQANHTVDVIVPSTAQEDYLPLKDVVDELKIFPLQNRWTGYLYSSLKYYPSTQVSLWDLEMVHKKIAEYINHHPYDVVLCEQDIYTVSPFFLKYNKKPIVYYCQQPAFYRYHLLKKLSENLGYKNKNMMEKGFLFNYYVKSIMKIDSQNIRHAPYLVANSYFSHESILKQYGQNSYVSYLGVDTNKFKPVQSKEGDFILSVGLCTPEKGYDFIIRSLAKIEADIRPRLLIVSNQENKLFEEYLINLSRSKGVEIEIRNSVDDQELVLLYNQAQLVVFASYLEPFGLVPLEAMACGTPVLAVREGGMRESIIHNKTGVLTERDETLFAKAATHILEDPSYQEYLAKNSLKEVKNFWNTEMAGQRLLIHLKRVYDIEE